MADRIQDLGVFTAYGEAREAGYEGSKAEFELGLKKSAEYTENAQASAEAAAASADDAELSAAGAAESAEDAETSAGEATQSASDAAASAAAAADSATDAAASATQAASNAQVALGDIAPVFDATEAYNVGDYVIYTDGKLYRFIVAHAAGAWVETDAVEVELAGEVGGLKSAVEFLDETVIGIPASNYTEGKNIDVNGSIVDAPGKCVSEKIPYIWTGTTRYYYGEHSADYAIAFYASDDSLLNRFISNSNGIYRNLNAEEQVTGTVAYVRFSFKSGYSGKACINNSTEKPVYWTAVKTYSGGIVEDIEALQETAPGAGQLDAIETALNGSVSYNYTEGYGLNSYGELTESATKCVTEFIPYTWDTSISTRYTYSGEASGIDSGTYYICFYDGGKNFIKSFVNNANGYRGINPSTQLTSNPAFVRFSFSRGFEANVAQHNNTEVVYWVAGKSVVNGLKYAEMDSPEQIRATAATVTNGTVTAIDSVDIRKNLDIEFRGDITSFTDVVLGHGYNHNYAAYIKVDSTNVTVYRDDLDGSNNVVHTRVGDPIPHYLTIGTYLHVLIQQGDSSTATVTINTATGRFKQGNIEFNGRRGDVFATITGTMTNVAVTAVIRDLNKSVWCFGDSYQSIRDAARWPYYLNDDGYLDNCLFSGFPGANSAHEIVSFRRLINLAQPKYLIWALGMNNSDNGAINASWKQCVDEVIATCEEKSVTVILSTIPCVPTRDHTYKNAYIKNPPAGASTEGKRYIDFARCVGGETAGSYWYNWGDDPSAPDATAMLSSDKLHPSVYGAMALYAELLADAPEVMK